MGIRLREDSVPHLFEALLKGDLDALVTLYSPDVMSSIAGRQVQFEKLAEERFLVIAPPGHCLTKMRAVGGNGWSTSRGF